MRDGGEGQTLLPHLPHAIIIRIAENLPLKDLPNFISCCKSLASMTHDFYQERQVVDMSCFEPVTPGLCDHLIARFSVARLHKLCFRYDLRRQRSSYDLKTLDAILARFLDNVNPSNAHFQRDLRSGSPRMVDILAHCYYLDRFLSSQPQLREVDVDVEVSVFKVPSWRGQRMDWHLLHPFLTVDAVQRHCALLESYATHMSMAHNHMDLLHVQMRFLERCPKLKTASLVLVVGTEELERYERLRVQLALEQAVFYLPGWQVSPEQRRLNAVRLRKLGGRLHGLKKAVVSFRRRGCLADCHDLFTALPRIESLYFRCDFNPSYDIDEGREELFFGDAFSLLGRAASPLSRIVLTGVPEDEFERLFWGVLPGGVREVRVQLQWCSPNLDERRERVLDRFLKNAQHLETFCIAGVPPSQQTPVFFKAKNWRPRHPC